jgi:hypothetical protein
MHIARTCDERTSEMKEQHAAALRVQDAAGAKMEDDNAALKAELTASHAAANEAIAALKTENEWRVGGIPPPFTLELPLVPQFDRAWCAAVCTVGWNVNVDATAGGARARVAQNGDGYCALRSAAPLSRVGFSQRLGPGGQQLPAYRVVVDSYGAHGFCRLGFVPSHEMRGGVTAAAVAPTPQYGIHNYGGWSIEVRASRVGAVNSHTPYSGWTVMAAAASAYDNE